MVPDKTIHKACRTHTTLFKQNPLEKFSLFTKTIHWLFKMSKSW